MKNFFYHYVVAHDAQKKGKNGNYTDSSL